MNPSWSKLVFPSSLVIPLLAACTGVLSGGDPQIEVKSLSMLTDDVGGLYARDCAAQKGGQGACAKYPNPLGCNGMELSVRADGSVIGSCETDTEIVANLMGITQGIPFICRRVPTLGCVQCLDIFGGAVVDDCGSGVTLFSGVGFKAPPGSEYIGGPQEDDPIENGGASGGSIPKDDVYGGGSSECENAAVETFKQKFNQWLQQEKFPGTFTPGDAQSQLSDSGFLKGAFERGQVCNLMTPFHDRIASKCSVPPRGLSKDAEGKGNCFCKEPTSELIMGCHCGRMVNFILLEICANTPPQCAGTKEWEMGLSKVYGQANSWFIKTASKNNYVCWGSPIVLDINDDGLSFSSLEDGILFDLSGVGPINTAWVNGKDDELLVMDANGNGRIDNGSELFGSFSTLIGPTDNGFQSLAALDRPAHGGNGNGLVECNDLMFEQLQLWNDRNRDGKSQPQELRSLGAGGVAALSVSDVENIGDFDQYGNDIGLRGSFQRSNGKIGRMIDVSFVTGSQR